MFLEGGSSDCVKQVKVRCCLFKVGLISRSASRATNCRMKVLKDGLDDPGSKRRMRMLVMKLMMRDYFRLMVGRNLSDCYIQLWESKTSRSGRPFSPSDASHHPLPRRGLTRKFVFPPSLETSSEQMRTVSRFSSSCDECFARRRRRLRCPALRASRALSLNRGPRVSGGANRKPANNLRGSSACRSRAASTGNKEPSAAPRQCRQPCGESGDAPGTGQGPGAPCAVPSHLAGRGLALGVAPNCGLGRPAPIKTCDAAQ